jgi:ribosomal protein S18 acetylase RimI-like enzyme
VAKSDPGVVTVRPFTLEDLDAAVDFCTRARAEDPSIEPFAQRLQVIATGPRALLELWRVAEGEDGLVHGLSFAAVRETRAAPAPVAGEGTHAPKTQAQGGPAHAGPAAPASSDDKPLRVPAIRGPAAKGRDQGSLDKRVAAAPGLVFAGAAPPTQAPRPGALLAQAQSAEARGVPVAGPFPVAPSERTFTAPPPVPLLPEKRGLRKVPVAKARTGPLSPEELGQAAPPPIRPPQPRPQPEGEQAAESASPEREGSAADERTTLEVYTAVSPALRRQGLGRALCEGALEFAQAAPGPVTLRARMKDGEGASSQAAQAFLASLGFVQVSAQLSLSWRGAAPPAPPALQGLQLRVLRAGDKKGLYDLERLSEAAWAGAPDSFATRADELAQMLEELERIVLLATLDGPEKKAAGYLSAVWLGKTLGIEEVAVLPDLRRAGLGRALVESALSRGATAAVLSVSEANKAARALYKGLGFTQTARKLIWERRSGEG